MEKSEEVLWGPRYLGVDPCTLSNNHGFPFIFFIAALCHYVVCTTDAAR